MNKLFKLLFLLITTALFNVNTAKASHVAGADITYIHLGGDSFLVTMHIFEDCGSTVTVGPNETIRFTSQCGDNFTLSFPQISSIEVSQLCPSEQINSTCSGGTLPGMMQKTFENIVVLPPCNFWTMAWGVCCRNSSINLDPAQTQALVITAQLNNVGGPTNNSPVFNAQPIPYVCANQLVNYSFGVSEIDGDSLVYSFADPLGGTAAAPTPANWNGSGSTQQPLPGIVIDPNTGVLTFTPTTLGNFVLCVQVEEFDDNGVLIGVVRRDIQFVVISCSNLPPNLNAGQITNLTGNAIANGPYSLTLCEGQTFTFSASFSDPDVTDTLALTTNLALVLPGATMVTTGTNPVNATISWTATPGSSGSNTLFSIAVSDQSCPYPGLQTFTYIIDVTPSTVITTPDSTIVCSGDPVQLNAEGGTIFTWYDMSNNIIPVGPQFSCNTCPSPFASPLVTTTYVVESNLASVCINRDTVTIVAVPNYQVFAVASDSSICSGMPITYNTQIVNGGTTTFTYDWTSPGSLNNDTIVNPNGTFNNGGIFDVIVQVSSVAGCVKMDTVTINVVSAAGFQINAYSDLACAGDTVQFHLDVSGGGNNPCGIASTPCSGSLSQVMVGSGFGANSILSYPAPYGNFNKSAKHQFLYHASDLNSAGFTGGKLSALAFSNNDIVGSVPVYHDFTIKLKCTTDSILGTTFDTVGLQTVYLPKDYTIGVGYVDHVFDFAYDWDGVSNLLVEVCFDNTAAAGTTFNVQTQNTTTTYISTLYATSNTTSVCGAFAITGQSGELPNIRLGYCASSPDINTLDIVWSPTSFLQNLNTYSPIVIPPGDTLYTVQVTNDVGCVDTDTIHLILLTSFNPTLAANTDTSFCPTDPAYTLVANPGGGTWAGDSITSAGVFNPNVGVGIYHVTYTVGQGTSCVDSVSVDLVVALPVSAAINPPSQTTLCATGSSITLTGVNAGGTWSGSGISSSGVFDPTLANIGANMLYHTIGNPCTAVDSITINVLAAPVVNIQTVGTYCSGDTSHVDLTYVPTNPNLTEVWSGPGITNTATGLFQPSTAGAGTHTIVVTVTNTATSCTTTDTISIVVILTPLPVISSSSLNYCKNDAPVQLNFTPSGGNFSGSTAVNGVTGLFTPSAASLGVQISIVYSIGGTCPAISNTLTLIVNDNPVPPVLSQDSTVCVGDYLPANQISGTSATGVVNWYNTPSLNPLINSGTAYGISIANTDTIYAEAELNGCKSAVSKIVPVFNPNTAASFTTNPLAVSGLVQGGSPLTVVFTHTYPGNSLFEWNFGDGSPVNTTELDPTHVYADSGIYRAILKTTNQYGCTDTTGVTIFSEEPLFIPNIFTPGGGDQNESFRFIIDGNSLTSFSATIFDRWGKKVTTFTSPKDVWDGTNYPAGTYYWTIEAVKLDGTPWKENNGKSSGYFQLVR